MISLYLHVSIDSNNVPVFDNLTSSFQFTYLAGGEDVDEDDEDDDKNTSDVTDDDEEVNLTDDDIDDETYKAQVEKIQRQAVARFSSLPAHSSKR